MKLHDVTLIFAGKEEMDPLNELRQLVYVANEHTRDSQLELLWRITDVFLNAPASYSQQQTNCFGEIMEQLAYDLEEQIRMELSRRMADVAFAPHGLIRRLAEDRIAVARPVLEQSPVLNEDDLVEIATRNGQQHCLAVTKRTDIGGRLSSVLVAVGDDEVSESLALNRTAMLTPETAGRLARQAASSPRLRNALIDRDDVPREVLVRVLDEVSEKMRRAIDARPGGPGAAVLDDATDAVRATVEECPASRAERYIDDLARYGALSERTIVRLVHEDRPMEFLVGLARLCGMDVVAMENVLGDASGQTLIIVCRAMGFSLATFKTIAVSRMCAVSSDITEFYPLTRLYRHFTDEKARRALRFLQMRGYTVHQEAERTENSGLAS